MNVFTSVCNLCKEPVELELGGRPCVKLRLADNTFGENNETLYFDAIFSGPDVKTAVQLDTGDQVVVSGELRLGSYKATKGKFKGKTMTTYSVPFAKLIRVTKSKFLLTKGSEGASDFPSEPEQGDDSDPTASNDTPASGGVDPLADLG